MSQIASRRIFGINDLRGAEIEYGIVTVSRLSGAVCLRLKFEGEETLYTEFQYDRCTWLRIFLWGCAVVLQSYLEDVWCGARRRLRGHPTPQNTT